MTFSVRLLLCTIALFAVVVSSLVGANEKSLRFIGTTTFLLCLIASTVALVGSGKSRTLAIGFLVGCLPYVYLAVGDRGNWRRYLATEVALETLDRHFHWSEPRKTPAGETVQLHNNGRASVSTPRGFGRTRNIMMSWEDVERMGHMKYAYKEDLLPQRPTLLLIGHFGTALLLGSAGGVLALAVNKHSLLLHSQLRMD